jgi:hypothetical protein
VLSFSQRNGLKPATKAIQLESLDRPLRTRLWNFLTIMLWDHWQPVPHSYTASTRSETAKQVEQLGASIWAHYLGKALDRMPPFNGGYDKTVLAEIRSVVFSGAWNEVFDLLEFIVKWSPDNWGKLLQKGFNAALEGESSAYRIGNPLRATLTSAWRVA